jgi:hypothetical protein
VTHHVRLAAAATAELSSEAIQLAELSSEAVQLAERSSVRARLIQLAELSGEAVQPAELSSDAAAGCGRRWCVTAPSAAELVKRPSTQLAYLSAAGFRRGLAPARSGVQVKVPHFDA